MSIKRIQSLSCWQTDVVVEPLAGGITNRNYVVQDGPRKFVARWCEDLSRLGIDRRNELACQHAAAAIGVAPPVVHAESPIVVTQWVAGKTLAAEDVRDEKRLSRVVDTLRRLHGAWDELRGELLYFSPFQTIRTYTATARELGAQLPDTIDELLSDAARLERRIAPFRPVLCHNDLLPANLIENEQQVWLVDWEYGGVGHPLFDLAGLTGNCELDEGQEQHLLRTYLGREPAAQTIFEFRLLKTVSLLREALWAMIQTVASDLEFDYAAYAAENLSAYRDARARLDVPTG